MNRNGFEVIMNIMFLFLISILLSFPIDQAYCDTIEIDDDAVLEFYWDAATGNVSIYNVYLSTNGSEYKFIETTSLPTISNPYSFIASNGSVYQIKVAAKDPNGVVGPMSLPSNRVLCQVTQSITLNLLAGWNLISCPGDPVISDIPTLVAGKTILPYGKVYNPTTKAYENKTTMEYVKGYWFGAGANTQLTINYSPRTTLTASLLAGWNIVGSISESALVSDIAANPPGSILPYGKWWNPATSSYVNETTMQPGKGYWFGTGNNCSITISNQPGSLSFQSEPGAELTFKLSDYLTSLNDIGPPSIPVSNIGFIKDDDELPGINYIITATTGADGNISPSGTVEVNSSSSQMFVITPSTGYHVKDVKVDGISVGALTTYTFTNVTLAHTIEATFEINAYTITATVGSGGTISPSGPVNVNCDNSQAYTIEPSSGYNISDVKIDGKSVGVLTTYTFSNVKEDHTIQATFTIIDDKNTVVDYTITAIASVGGNISPSETVKVNIGASQTFAITSSTGYHIKDVKVDGKSVGVLTTYIFSNVKEDHTIEATFEINTYTITAIAGSGGTISLSGSINVNYGDDKTFTLTLSTGYHVSDLKIDGKSVGALTTYTFSNVKEDHTIQATFAIIDYTMTATAGAGGNISPSGTVKVNSIDNQTFAITPSTGYHIKDVKVDDKSVGVLTTYTFTNITSAHTIEATFELSDYTIIATAGDGGTISPSGTITVNCGANLLFNISQANDYHIADVKVDGQSVGAVSTYVFKDITQNHTIEVSFAINTYNIIASAGDGGTISPSGAVMVNHGANQEFTITPSSYHHIVNVKVDDKSLGAISTYTFTNVTSNHIIEISFAIDTLAINAMAGSGGDISPSGSITVNRGENKTFTIIPSDGYEIVDVKVDGHSEGALASYTFTNVIINHTIEASFAKKIYTITASADSGGTITPSGIMTVEHGSNQKISIKPDEGHIIACIVVDGVIHTDVSDTYIFTNITSDHSILVKFNDESFVIKTKSGPHGFIWPAITPISKVMDIPIKYGETKLFTISPDIGYYVTNANVDGQSIGAVTTYTFSNVTSNHVLEATFELKTYIISVVANNGGTITPSGTASISHGSDQTFTATPSDGYHVTDVLVDGKSVGVVASYTFSNVTTDHKIEAIFAIDTHTINAIANNGGTITPSGTVSVNYGSDQAFTITPSDNYHVTDVLVDDKSVGAVATYTFSNVTTDHKIEAIFAIDTHTINAIANNGGTITPSGTASINHGSDQTFTATPSDGYHVIDMLVDGKSVGALATYTFFKVTETHTIEVSFAITEYIYTITASSGNGGTIIPSGEVKVNRGEMQKFIMIPADGYVIQDVRIDGQPMSTINKFVFANVTSDHTIYVKFRLFGNPVGQNELLQNYPNPFNPETWIPYQLKVDSDVTICIYNIRGELVRKLNVGHKPPGFYLGTEKAAYWDGKNATGERVASGVYFYTIQAGKFTATRRMIVID